VPYKVNQVDIQQGRDLRFDLDYSAWYEHEGELDQLTPDTYSRHKATKGLVDTSSCLDRHKQDYFIEFLQSPQFVRHGYFNTCYHNEYMGLTQRHILKDLVSRNQDKILRLRKDARKLANKIEVDVCRINHVELISNTRSCVVKRYIAAYKRIKDGRLIRKERFAGVSSFVKFEKFEYDKLFEKAPRMIQHRSFEYLYTLKRLLWPFSKAMLGSNKFSSGQEIKSIFMKGRTQVEMAAVFQESWNSFVKPIAVCIDHSKFDAHVCWELLSVERVFWVTLAKEYLDDDLAELVKNLLMSQCENKGRTKYNIRYKVLGTRMSGEYTTSDGNSLINYLILRKVMGKRCKIHVNGDDSVVIMEKQDYDKVTEVELLKNFEVYNMESKIDRVAYEFEKISFCQCSPVMVGGRYTMIKDPIRTMSRSSVCPFEYLPCLERYKGGIGLCELATNQGVPILQAFAIKLINSKVKPLGCVDKTPAKLSGNVEITIKEISLETRMSFSIAFDITPSEQIEWETTLAGNQIGETQLINFIKKYKNFHKN